LEKELMSGPWDDYTPPSDVASMVTAEAQKQGLDPDLALRVANQESGLNHGRVSPAGAIGVMQLMPNTAHDLGVDPSDMAQNIRGGVSYLKQQMDTFKDPRLAAAAYNAGPGAVHKYNGVPPYPETQKYVDAVAPGGSASPPWMDYSQADDAQADQSPAASAPAQAAAPGPHRVAVNPETNQPYNAAQQAAYSGLMDAGKLDPSAAPGSETFPRGLSDPKDTPNPGDWFVGLNGKVQQAPGANYRRDAVEGFAKPWVDFGHDAAQSERDALAGKGSITDLPRTALALAAAIPASITGAMTRPAADAVRQVLPTPYSAPQLSMDGGKLSVVAPQPLHGAPALDATQGMLDTSLSGLRASPTGLAASAPKTMTLEQVIAAKKAAYGAVDASGFKFPQADVQQLATDIAGHVAAKGGPSGAKLYPASNAMSDRVTALAQQPGGVPLTQLDELRSDIYGALVKPGDREAPIGVTMRQKIDDLINGASAPNIQEARDLNTRYMKMQAVTDRLDSAGLRSASTYSGGNYGNAVRQSLRPLIDPTSGARIGNLSQPEQAALRSAVTGTPGQNLTRWASKFLTNKFVQVPASLMTHGIATPVMEAAGSILNKVGEGQTDGAVQRVLDLISRGPTAATQAPIYPTLALGAQQPISILSPRGLIGGAAVARQFRNQEAAQKSPWATTR
jgi:hypothetical protein